MEPNPWPSLSVYARVFGDDAVRKNPGAYVNARPVRQAEDATHTARQARAEAETLHAMTPAEALERIRQTRAAEQVGRGVAARALEDRRRQLGSRSPERDSGTRESGPSIGR